MKKRPLLIHLLISVYIGREAKKSDTTRKKLDCDRERRKKRLIPCYYRRIRERKAHEHVVIRWRKKRARNVTRVTQATLAFEAERERNGWKSLFCVAFERGRGNGRALGPAQWGICSPGDAFYSISFLSGSRFYCGSLFTRIFFCLSLSLRRTDGE